MKCSAYTEERLVERPAAELLNKLGWQTVSAMEEVLGTEGTLGRETQAEVVLLARLSTALRKLNPGLADDAVTSAAEELTRDRSSMSLAAANREVYGLLKDGVKVSVPDREKGGQKIERLRVVDWESPSNNDFLAVRQFSVVGPLYTCRPDIVGFVNGLPLVVLEFKKPGVPAKEAYDENFTSYLHPQNGCPALFWYNAFLIASNGTESRAGTITADWDRFFEWKRIAREDEPRTVSLETILRGTCDRGRLLDLVENFTLFSEHKMGLVKVLAQNHQFLGVNQAIASAMAARAGRHGRGGVFWQTQGSGKSFAMVFFGQKILRKMPGNWTFVVVTDRVELDDQIAKTFAACGAVTDAKACHASSGANLRQLLGENHRYVFTLIHKFQTPEVLCDRPDVIVLTDEAHRSQYDTLALNMRSAMPKATFLAFTGTPLIAGEERTREVFGDYVSIYDFQQSVTDGATVPLFYENRAPELELTNPDLNDDIYRIIEEAGLNEEQEDRLAKVLGTQYHILTRDDRLETVAKDIVRHFLGRGFAGKAMVVSIDKATALRMHDKVRKHWARELKRAEKELARVEGFKAHADPEELAAIQERVRRLKETDLAVIVSPAQNEVKDLKALGVDIVPHRKRMNTEDLDEKFKDSDDPLSLVFLCAMWLTGFDAPRCSTVYLDKPMRNHTLMQTIARANRVFPGKHHGMIVDYANVFASLERALAIYGATPTGASPVRDKAKLVEELRKGVDDVTGFCAQHGVSLEAIEQTAVGGLERLSLISQAVNALISPDPVRKDFLAREGAMRMLYEAVKPDPVVHEFSARVACLGVIADEIRRKTRGGPVDVSGVMGQIEKLLDESVAGVDIRDGKDKGVDLSKIDFEALAKRFKKSKTRNIDLEILKAAIRAQLEKLLRFNRTRTDFQEKFEELIEAYNAGSRTIEQLLEELIALSRALTEEQTRHVRENLSPDELVIFDILTRPAPELSSEERDGVKKVARQLLNRLKGLLVLEWRRRAQSRAKVRLAIEEALDEGLPKLFDRRLYTEKCSRVFEHVFETYAERASAE